MGRILLSVVFILLYYATVNAQTPQFAVVRPDGTTYICTTLDSAYRRAVNEDAIYLPGGSFTLNDTIKKKLNFFGAGICPDSTTITGRSNITSPVTISQGASESSFQGIAFTYTCASYCDNTSVYNFAINVFFKNCEFYNIRGYNSGLSGSNSVFRNCLINGSISNFNNSIISSCVIGGCGDPSNCQFYNSIFITAPSGSFQNRFENNIFLINQYNGGWAGCGDIFLNNLKVGNIPLSGTCSTVPPSENGTITQSSVDSIFISYSASSSNYRNNYHLKSACLGKNAGTDGTDVGIYGTSTPTLPGWVPTNPHIYYKQVAAETNANGQLQIQFKVRTNN